MKKSLCALVSCALLSICSFVSFAQNNSNKWALGRISVAHVRVKPGHASELSSQIIMGMPVKLLNKSGDWWQVETHEGYKGYIISNSLSIKSSQEMNVWRNSDRVVVTSLYQTIFVCQPFF